LTGAAMPLSLVAKSVAVFAAVGMSAGFAMGATIGNASGGSAAVAREQEERLREVVSGRAPELAQGVVPPPVTPVARLKQGLKEWSKNSFNPKVAALFATLGVGGGLVMAAAFIAEPVAPAMPALGMLLGKTLTTASVAANATAIATYFAGVMGLFGAIFGLNLPKLGTELTHFTGDLLSGEALGTSFGSKPQRVPQPSVAPEAAVATQRIDPPQEGHSHVILRKYESYQELLSHQAVAVSGDAVAKR
jgi:hypothetical protein